VLPRAGLHRADADPGAVVADPPAQPGHDRHRQDGLRQDPRVHGPRRAAHPRSAGTAHGRRPHRAGARPDARACVPDRGGEPEGLRPLPPPRDVRVRRRTEARADARPPLRRARVRRVPGAPAGPHRVARDEHAPRDVPRPGRGGPHAGHGLRAADPQDRRADPPAGRPADADVLGDVAGGGAPAGAELHEGPRARARRQLGPPREHRRAPARRHLRKRTREGPEAVRSVLAEPGQAHSGVHGEEEDGGRPVPPARA